MTIAVAVSGGADSLYAMASLQREYPGQVIAFHALQKETLPEDDPVPGLEASCRALGVPLHILDLQEAFFRQIVPAFRGELRPRGNAQPVRPLQCAGEVRFVDG